MKRFMDADFLLSTETAKRLYHETAEQLPIIDYHCHLSPKEIAEDKRFSSITELWLGGDHYKWRLMRSFGIEERYITGDASDREKFRAWAQALGTAIGNPLYHWSHMELRAYFGYEGVLNEQTADAVFDLCNEKLRDPSFSARNLILRSNVEALCTTDDPADSLEWHKKIADSGFTVKVLPSFRPDKALGIEKPDWASYLNTLGTAVEIGIQSFSDLCEALEARAGFFAALGCCVSDHGLSAVPFAPATEEQVEAIFQKRRCGERLDAVETAQFQTALLLRLGRIYAKLGWVMQLHFGVLRDNAKRVYAALGPDAGIDSIGDAVSISDLAAFLNALDETDELPKTILYSLNPNDNTALATVMGAFQHGGTKGKLQLGSAWWFNDHKDGIRNQLSAFASEGHLATFVGMLTDSRSFLSYPRHEYFRRILCNLIGTWVEDGEFPNDEKALDRIVRGISFDNARKYFCL
ncbi:MAG: glucuronate isomerase [Clostridia bacterium]|nr:glucuronate isomerase [Clostridia bacterium]